MKRHLLPVMVAVSAIGVGQPSLAANPTAGPVENSLGSNWHYSPGVGLIYGDEKIFAEGIGKAVMYHVKEDATDRLSPVGDLQLDSSGDSRVVFRLQESLDTTGAASQPATFDWKNEDGAEDWNARGALLVDIYFDHHLPFGYDRDRMSFHLSFGAELNKYQEGGKDVDNQTFFALLNFRPDFLPNMSGQSKYWKQPIRIGGVYHRDNLTDDEQWGLVFRYDPVFRMFKKLGIGYRNRYVDDGTSTPGFNTTLVKPEGDGKKSEFTSEDSAVKGDPTNPLSKPAAGLDIRPLMGLKLADGSAVSSAKDLTDAYLQYGMTVALPLFHERVELGYSLICNTAVNGGSDTHTAQTAFLNISPRPRGSKSPIFIRAAYHSGEAAPTFEEHQGWSIGLGIRL